LSRSGEFGSTYDPLIHGAPIILGVGESSSGSPISAGIATPAAGNTNLLLGVDFFGASSTAGALIAGLEWEGFGMWAQWVGLVAPGLESGCSWRGALPIGPTNAMTMVLTVEGTPVECGCLAWGVVLPYWAP
jgi:hypothetical protein